MMTMACTSSAIDQLSAPLSRSLKEEGRRGGGEEGRVCVCAFEGEGGTKEVVLLC